MTRHIFLVGFMGAGKSTVGRVVAQRLARPFVDLDERIEAVAGRTIREIFETDGEEAFRALETAALEALSGEAPSVVACGGGVVIRPENRAVLKRDGVTVYLQVTAGEAIARVGDTGTRPLLSGPGASLAATTLLAARESLYRTAADVTIDTVSRDADEVADMIIDSIGAVG